MNQFPARIHVLFARDSLSAVVIRSGPSDQVATIHWDRQNDEFRLGQWLKGRIYERRSDLSPDGRHLIYFAMNGRWSSESKGAWTAISRVPYLKAIAFFPKGDCWNGGGLWTGDNTYWLNDGYGHTIARDTTMVLRDHKFQPKNEYGRECLSVYYSRLVRDGWKLIKRMNLEKHCHQDIFEISIGEGWTLRKVAHSEIGAPMGKGCYWDEHEIARPFNAEVIKCPDWEWAELDRNRLVWAANGKLHAAILNKNGIDQVIELYDFNDMKFKAIAAPYTE